MRSLSFAILVLMGSTSSWLFGVERAEAIVSLDASADERWVTVQSPGARGTVSGHLPLGWEDNSAWADLDVHYRRADDGLGGAAWLRVEFSRRGNGAVNIRHPLPLLPEGNYVVRMTARSPVGNAVVLGVREIPEPFRFLWRQQLTLDPARREYEYRFFISASSQPIALFLVIPDTGVVEVSRLEIAPAPSVEEDIDAPAPVAANMLPVSRFPGGRLPVGWGHPERVRFSAGAGNSFRSEDSISGYRVLRVEADEEATLFSPTFAGGGRMFVAIHARGKGSVRLQARDGTRLLRETEPQELKPGEWSRVVAAFDAPVGTRNLNFTVLFRGEVEIDAFQLGRGELVAYAPSAPAELVMETWPGRAANARIFFEDEPVSLRYLATGQLPTGAQLMLRVVDVYGAEYPPQRVAMEGDAYSAIGRVELNLPGAPAYGAFRVEARVENAAGEPLSHWSEIVFHRFREPRHWGRQAPADSPFGFHVRPRELEVTMARAVGVGWVRLHATGAEATNWVNVEPRRGEWRWRDDIIDLYREAGFNIFGVFTTAPRWASYFSLQPRGNHGYYDLFYAPRDLEAWDNYVKTVAARYREVIRYWDVWNEPWGHFWHTGLDPSKRGVEAYTNKPQPEKAADFAELTRRTRRALHQVDPELRVVGLDTSPNQMAVGWTEDVMAAGGIEPSDILGFHQYNAGAIGFPGDALEQAFEQVIGPLRQPDGSFPRPIWQKEGQPNIDMHQYGLYHYTTGGRAQDDNVRLAERIAAFHATYFANGVEKVFLYTMSAHGTLGLRMFWPVMILNDASLHPSAGGYSAMTWMLDGQRFVERFQNEHGNTVHLFEGDGRTVALIISRPGQPRFQVPRRSGLTGADVFGNPVRAGEVSPNNVLYLQYEGDANALRRLLVP
jgi:hypothetical protein